MSLPAIKFAGLPEVPLARSIPETVAAALRDGILTGRLPAGTQLKQDHLARHFRTSRAPIREALQALAGEGLLTINRHRGITVTQADPNDLRELGELRIILEAHAIGLSIPNLNEVDLKQARSLLEEAEFEQMDASIQSDLHWRFHRVIMSRADRPRLLTQIEHLHITVSRYLFPAWIAAGLSVDWVSSHKSLLILAEQRRGKEAAELNSSQIEEACDRVACWLLKQET